MARVEILQGIAGDSILEPGEIVEMDDALAVRYQQEGAVRIIGMAPKFFAEKKGSDERAEKPKSRRRKAG